MKHKMFWVGIGLATLALIVVACSSPTPAPPVIQEVTREVEVTRVVEVTVEPPGGVPFEELWQGSGHADVTAEAFVHWNEESPAEVPADCAKCHSTPGYLDFTGADGSAAGTVEVAAPVGTVITCTACHNDATVAMDSVTFPSGAELHGLGPEARCMQCHQGRASGASVDAAIEKAGLTDDDTTSSDLGFTNIHYFAAGASLEGTLTAGGYQYPGKSYDAKLSHVEGYNTCVGCHNPHSLEVKVQECQGCHQDVKTQEDLRSIRMPGSLVDYDGDGDVEESIDSEITGLRDLLYSAMQAYAKDVAGQAIAYDTTAYPYFFNDLNGNGTVDDDEKDSANKFASWTGRLAKAAYNYQTSLKDPGAFAHGGKYVIELLYDSTEDLNSQLSSSAVDLSNAHRIDAGHFAGSEEAFRHWDAEMLVPGTCAKCHAPGGLPQFLANNATVGAAPGNGLECATCHNDLTTFTRYTVDSVRFPSGATVTFGEGEDANLCLNCHQGRESTNSVNTAIGALGPDEVGERLGFRNIHYFAAGATLFGTDVKGAYEYAGQTYLGQNLHVEAADTCIECHDGHALTVNVEKCSNCHNVEAVEDTLNIRADGDTTDWDGDGDATEGIAGEIATMREALYAAVQAYGVEQGTPILYNTAAYPYFFVDADQDGQPDKNAEGGNVGYNAWTPRLLKAAYNYQYSAKDPGAFAHNGKYVLQFLYDSIADLDPAGVAGMTRP